MENFERTELSKKVSNDDAEAKMRTLEREPSLRTSPNPDVQSQDDTSPPVDTSNEWWNKKDVKQQPGLLDRAKEVAVIGAAGAVLIGSTFLLGHEAIDQYNNSAQSGAEDVTQTQVVQDPNEGSPKFVEADVQYTLKPEVLSPEQPIIKQESPVQVVAKEASASSQINNEASNQAQNEWWLKVPEYSQHNLTNKGANTEYGCVPTSTSMVLDYWHGKDPANLTQSSQELLDANTSQGEFGRYGMSSSNIHDEMDKLGYASQDHVNSNMDELKSAVAEGPVLAIVKLGIKPSGDNHTVVVTGISDQNEVRVNDPWTGEAHTYSWDQFSRSWGANFGKDAPTNNFTTIRPKTL